MKKTLFTLVAGMLAMIMIAGCSSKQTESIPSSAVSDTVTTEPTVTPPDESQSQEVKYASLIPDPAKIFTEGKISILDEDGGKAYMIQVKNPKDGEYDHYISECKKMGFENVQYEWEAEDGGRVFGAYSIDGKYWIDVYLGNTDATPIVTIVCQTSTKYTSD